MTVLTWHVASRWAEPDGTLTPEAMRFMSGFIDELRQISTGGRFAAEEITPTGSPFSYTAPRRGAMTISGVLVQKVVLNRNGSDVRLRPDVTIIPVSQGDKVTVTYIGNPVMTWLPR